MTRDRLSDRLRRTPREAPRCALVTGASGGIGEAFARALPDTTRLVLTGRNEDKLSLLRAEIGPRAETVVADLGSEDGVARVAEAAEAAGCDLLINNAGLGALGDFLSVDLAAHRTALRVNVEAVLELTHRLTPGMIERADREARRAGVINVASSVAFVPVPSFATYAATKALILSFTEAFAAEMADAPVDVLCACPGAVRTGFGARSGYGSAFPGAMSPEKVARTALAALGRQTTVMIGPVSTATLAPVALARSMVGQAFHRAGKVIDRVQDRQRRG
ncbi:SDR family NAD(P)-dependent oxidoreductase [Acuticoccus sp.]|uniref:SDR family NAD(P)-dependent oxidoreductase n=1 Tax=Acuticoccus sp. TaxID=1904378 RepID=UPI003B51E2B4